MNGMCNSPRELTCEEGPVADDNRAAVEANGFHCRDLPSTPVPSLGMVLVTGATGYIGGRLVPELLARGYQVRAMLRAPSPEHAERWPTAETVVADAADQGALREALQGVHTAYYLIHSLLLRAGEFEAAELTNARNFRQVAEDCGVQRIIYLGGLGDVRTFLSPHLRSRIQVAKELQGDKLATTVVRAAIIIGSGSASYEIILNLVRRLPVIFVPYWGRTRCQPIAVRDVIRYLVGVLETPATAGESLDIGGTDVLTYEGMMRTLAEVLGKRRLFVPVAFSHIGFYAYLAGLLIPVPARITASLMAGLRSDVVCQDGRIRVLLPFRPLSYKEAVVQAMSRDEQDAVYTRWSDAYPPAHELAIKLRELQRPPRYTTSSSLQTEKPASALFSSLCRIGGAEGWFHGNWMWRLRGMIDSVLLGVGSTRGRRSTHTLRINDVIDFWRVEDMIPDERLLLRAEMKLPGKAWLEFRIAREGPQNRLSVVAHYETRSLSGHLYWYMVLPFHRYIFDNLIGQIERRS